MARIVNQGMEMEPTPVKKKRAGTNAVRLLDDVDRGIMAELSENPQAPLTAMPREVGVSELGVASRIDGLIADKMMRVTIQRDIRTLGYTMLGIVDVYVAGADVDEV